MMNYQFTFRRYQRHFLRPLQTAHGFWTVREGIIIQLIDPQGKKYRGEIAPIPWFGSESLAMAIEFCLSLPQQINLPLQVPDHLPATQFAFSAAILYGADDLSPVSMDGTECILLPAGTAVLNAWQAPWAKGYRTFKWKIGVLPVSEELAIFDRLLTTLPPGGKIRLDANASLNHADTSTWLENLPSKGVEFLEQPTDICTMLRIASSSPIPLALDESVSNIYRLRQCYEQGWRGIYVIKPAIAGPLKTLADFIGQQQLDVVISSSFETNVGRQAILRWAAAHDLLQRSAGLGTSQYFVDQL
jgi:o-succinylbenzoate synthase